MDEEKENLIDEEEENLLDLSPEAEQLWDADDHERFEFSGGSSDGMYYDLTQGGYFHLEKMLTPESVAKVREALEILEELQEIYSHFVEGC